MLVFLLTITDEKDRNKIAWIYDKFHDDMLRIAKKRLKEYHQPNYETDAQDAVQSTFLNMTKYVNRIDFTSSEKEIRNYVLISLEHEIIKLVNEQKWWNDIDTYSETLADSDFFEKINISERYQAVVEAILSLEEKYRYTLWFYYKEGLTVKRISGIMGVSEKTVYTRLERGKALLLEKLPKED